MENKTKQYPSIDICKLVMSIFVVIIHVNTLFRISDPLIYKSIDNITELAVPFFFMASGFLTYKKYGIERKGYWRYTKKIFMLYCIWTAIYFPFTLYAYIQEGLGVRHIAVFLRNFLFVGQNEFSWQLWYLLAIIYSVILKMLFEKMGFHRKTILIFALGLYCGGRFMSWMLSQTTLPMPLNLIAKVYDCIFVSTMNGPLFGFAFFELGEFFAVHNNKKSPNKLIPVLAFILGLIANGYGFFPGLVLSTIALFYMVINCSSNSIWKQFDSKKLRLISNSVYFTHMIFLSSWYILCVRLNIVTFFSMTFSVVIGVTMMLGYIMLQISKREKGKVIIKILFS